MRITYPARAWQDGKLWLIECKKLGIVTQGKTLTDAHLMLKDAIESLVNQPGFTVKVIGGRAGNVTVIADNPGPLLVLALKRAG